MEIIDILCGGKDNYCSFSSNQIFNVITEYHLIIFVRFNSVIKLQHLFSTVRFHDSLKLSSTDAAPAGIDDRIVINIFVSILFAIFYCNGKTKFPLTCILYVIITHIFLAQATAGCILLIEKKVGGTV